MLKFTYDSKDDVPEGLESHYKEKDGKFVLQVEGAPSSGDVERTTRALKSEREAHRETRSKLSKFGDLDPDAVREKLDHVEELEARVAAASKDKPDEAALDKLVEARVKRQLAPVERERDTLRTKVVMLEFQVGELGGRITHGAIEQQLRRAAAELRVVGPAVEDVVAIGLGQFEVVEDNVITREAKGLTPGLDPVAWLKDQQEKRPHWWAQSVGGGAGGSRILPQGRNNPWSKDHWNMTEQGQVVRSLGAEKAGLLAQQAGTTLNGPRPTGK